MRNLALLDIFQCNNLSQTVPGFPVEIVNSIKTGESVCLHFTTLIFLIHLACRYHGEIGGLCLSPTPPQKSVTPPKNVY